MNNATCLRCRKGYYTEEPDIVGTSEDKCFECREAMKNLAFNIDIKIAERRKLNPLPTMSRIQQLKKLKEEQGGWLRLRDIM